MIIDRPASRDIPTLRQLWKQAFGDTDAFLDGFFSTGFSFDRCRCLHMDGQLAAALYWFDCSWQGKKVAYIYAVATDAAFQGQGLCRALMEDTHRQLRVRGYAGAALVPGNRELFALYEKFGYRSFCPMRTLLVWAQGKPVTPETISADSYALRRRSRIEKNAIVQDREAFRFLATFGKFYKASGSIFVVSKDQDDLYFQEYLGDPSLLGRIINAFGVQRALVRLPGGEDDSAMYLPLNDDSTLPAYLGIPLN